MCECKLILFGAFVLCNVILATSFNIDQYNYTVYKKDRGSMFGFTVAVHKDSRNDGWVLVGAPEATSSYLDPRYKGGAVYRCRIDADDYCQEIPFSRDNFNVHRGQPIDNKTEQWFGATLSTTSEKNGRIVACAPRYVWHTKDLNRRDPVGTCFVSDGNFQNSEEFSPCRTMNWGYHRQGSCQAGFSAAINREGDRLYVGAPGSYYWQGQMYSIDANATYNFTPGRFGNKGYGAKGSVHQQSFAREAVFSTREGKPADDDSYMGYSVVVGDFNETEEYECIAVGMPRGNGLKGKVLLYTWDLHNYKNLTASKQIGAYFGYSITAADVNGDKKLDIIVGAPMHTEPNNDDKYDVGRVYIFHQASAASFSNYTFIDGTTSKARFGHAVATLGDLNRDGFDDFAVGAPYGGPDGRGAVYIYYGSKTGIRKDSEQVIYAKNLQSSIPIQTFGFSISGGMDLDDNDYPDMAVGAYLSNAAFFFRSQPVVLVEAYVKFNSVKKQIDIKEKNCHIPGGLEALCIDIDFCMKYTGKEIPHELYFNVEYILDSKKPNTSRMAFFTRKTQQFPDTFLLYKDHQRCRTEKIYIKSDVRDKLTPLEAEMKYSLMDESRFSQTVRNPRSQLRPALDLNSPPSRKDYLIVQKNCGPDNICIPDLDISIEPNVKTYFSGSKKNLNFEVVISNHGEDSFETTFELKLPRGVLYTVYKSDMPGILCSPVNETLLSCDIGNPLPGKSIARFTIVVQPPPKEDRAPPSYDFDVFVNSTNPELELTKANNHKRISIDVRINASLELRGYSYPSTVYYNESVYTSKEIIKENDIGPQVTHVYYVRNEGPATVQEAELFILWPLETLGGEDLLYLVDAPHTKGNVKCDPGPVNHRNYLVNYYADSIWDRLRIVTSGIEEATAEASKVTEEGKGVDSGAGVINTNDAKGDDDKFSGGDSSKINEKRHNISNTDINSYGTMNSKGEYVLTKAVLYTVWVNGVPHTTWRNTTTIRDARGNILRTYSNDDASQSFGGVNNINVTQWSSGSGSNVNLYGTMNSKGEYVYTESESRTVWNNGIPSTTWRNTTTVRDAQGNILRTYSNDDSVQSSGGAENTNFGHGNANTSSNTNSYLDVNTNGESVYIEAESRTVWTNGVPQTTWRNKTTVKDAQGKVLRSWYSDDNTGESSDTVRNTNFAQGNYYGTAGENFVDQGSSSGTWQTNQEERARAEQQTRVLEQNARTQQSGYGQGDINNHHQNAGWDQSSGGQVFRTEEERRRYFEGRGRSETSQQQGGVQESQIQQQVSDRGRLSGGSRHHIRTGYIDQNGVYHNYTRHPSGEVTYNRSYIIETTDTVPIDLSGGRSGEHLGLGETALGSGFTVQTLDLGNAPSESPLPGGQSGVYYGAGSGSSRNSGGLREQLYEQDQESHQSRSGSSSGGSYRQNWQVERSYSQSGQHNSVERDNVPTDRPNPNARSRGRREINPYQEIQALIKCNATRCNYIRCVVGSLDKDREVAIAVRSRLNVRQLKNLTSNQAIQISSLIVGKISKLNMQSQSGDLLKEREVFTEIPAKEADLVPEVAPLWIYVVSAVAGVVMLLLLIWILSKCGFFKRNRPSSSPERQPLNRNGYHSGDEAL